MHPSSGVINTSLQQINLITYSIELHTTAITQILQQAFQESYSESWCTIATFPNEMKSDPQ